MGIELKGEHVSLDPGLFLRTEHPTMLQLPIDSHVDHERVSLAPGWEDIPILTATISLNLIPDILSSSSPYEVISPVV